MLSDRLSAKPLLLLLCGLIVVAAYFLLPDRHGAVIRLHDDQVEIQKLTNAITEFLIVEGYGYKVELVESTIKELHDHLINGDIDITLELWKENNLTWYSKAVADRLIIDLGIIYGGGKQYWIVSKWYAEEKGIKSVFDMKQHWKDFVDPDDPSKGLFFNCIVGWTCLDINRVKLRAYGLDKYYNTVSPVSPESLRAIYVNAQKRLAPVFGYYWEPNSIMAGHDWYALEEPPYSREVWEQVLKAASANQPAALEKGCAFKESGVHKVVHYSLADKAPDVYAMLEKMAMDTRQLNGIIMEDRNSLSGRDLAKRQAREYLNRYPDQWRSWLPDKVAAKVEKALQASSEEGGKG